MNRVPASEPPLCDLLKNEYRTLCEYLTISEQENEALVQSDVDAINVLAEQKQQLLARLAGARGATKRALGERATPQSIRGKLEAAGPEAADLFEMVAAKAREAIEVNKISTRLIAHQMRRLSQRSAILAGAGLSAAPAYGASGFAQLAAGSAFRCNR